MSWPAKLLKTFIPPKMHLKAHPDRAHESRGQRCEQIGMFVGDKIGRVSLSCTSDSRFASLLCCQALPGQKSPDCIRKAEWILLYSLLIIFWITPCLYVIWIFLCVQSAVVRACYKWVVLEWVLKPGNVLAFLHFRISPLKIGVFFKGKEIFTFCSTT